MSGARNNPGRGNPRPKQPRKKLPVAKVEGENKALDEKAWFLREVERRTRASIREIRESLDDQHKYDAAYPNIWADWLRCILGAAP
jgi:hypothetical protein